jgi:hypothetical protein
MMIVLCCAFI